MKNTTTEWLTAADDDLSAMKLIITDTGLTHIVAFHAQQAIEKTLKSELRNLN